MKLSKIGMKDQEVNTHVKFEKAADDLLMISVMYDTGDTFLTPSYWRLTGTGRNPPLEVGVNTEKKTITTITFFVDSDCVGEFIDNELNPIKGYVIVDTEIFKKVNDYLTINHDYSVMINEKKLICFFNYESDIKEAIGNGHVNLFINNDNEICGLEICDLEEQEMKIINFLRCAIN